MGRRRRARERPPARLVLLALALASSSALLLASLSLLLAAWPRASARHGQQESAAADAAIPQKPAWPAELLRCLRVRVPGLFSGGGWRRGAPGPGPAGTLVCGGPRPCGSGRRRRRRRRMGLELYLDLLSQPCRAVYLFAKANGIPFQLKDVELFKDSILGTKVPAETPAGEGSAQAGPQTKVILVRKVPVLKEDDFILAEGTAILLYLSRKYQTPDHWYPSDIQKRAKVDEYLSWHQANIRANAPKIMWIKVLIPLLTGQALPAEKLEEVMEGLVASLSQLEGMFLQDKAFLVGSEVSLADLVALVELMQPLGVGCDIFKDRPKLAAWRDRVEAALGKELFLQAHQLILNVKQLSAIQVDPGLKEQLAPALLKMMK